MGFSLVASLALVLAWPCFAESVATRAAEAGTPGKLLVQDGFEGGFDQWEPIGGQWQLADRPGGGHALRNAGKSTYQPAVTSPRNIALRRDLVVGDFELTVEVQSTAREYAHRDMCLFFGYRDPTHFYYVHLGRRADPHAHQIFIVNGAPRLKITEQGSDGTPWDGDWHKVRIVRRTADGLIEVFFDDMRKPILTAHDKTFPTGRIGLGTFDDEGNWDNVEVRGVPAGQ